MIAYKIQIVIDEDHEENFEEITKNIYDHIERIPGITEVHGDSESYFEYNEDINFEEEEDDKTDQEIVNIIKSSKTAKFSFPMMGCQELPIERIQFLLDAREKQIAKKPIEGNTFKHIGKCPDCLHIISTRSASINCQYCGQKIDWGNEE